MTEEEIILIKNFIKDNQNATLDSMVKIFAIDADDLINLLYPEAKLLSEVENSDYSLPDDSIIQYNLPFNEILLVHKENNSLLKISPNGKIVRL